MGWVYNLKDPNAPTNAPRLIAICLAFSTGACVATALRFYARFFIKRKPGLDDYATLSSTILSVAYTGVTIGQTRWGQALNPKFFPAENLIPFGKVQYAGGPIYTLALLGFKLSLLLSYLRIGGFNRTYCRVIYLVMAACIANQLAFTAVICFACNPIAKQWDFDLPGHCIETVKSYYALAGTSLGFDVVIITLPLPILWRLNLNLQQKMVLVGIFALGFFVTVIQIIRIFTIKNLKTYTNSESIIIWSVVEINIGVIITCIPTYAPLFHAFSERVTSGRTGSKATRAAGSQYPNKLHTGSASFNNLRSGDWHRNLASLTRKEPGSQILASGRDDDAHEMGDVGAPHRQHDYGRGQHSWKASADTDSEEHIIRPDDRNIYTVTEVRIESHESYSN